MRRATTAADECPEDSRRWLHDFCQVYYVAGGLACMLSLLLFGYNKKRCESLRLLERLRRLRTSEQRRPTLDYYTLTVPFGGAGCEAEGPPAPLAGGAPLTCSRFGLWTCWDSSKSLLGHPRRPRYYSMVSYEAGCICGCSVRVPAALGVRVGRGEV